MVHFQHAHVLKWKKRVTKKKKNYITPVAIIKVNIKPPLLHCTRYHLNLAYYGGHSVRPTSLSDSINAPLTEEDGCLNKLYRTKYIMTWGNQFGARRCRFFVAVSRRKSSHQVNCEQMAGCATADVNKESTKVFVVKLTGSVDDMEMPKVCLHVGVRYIL